MFALVALAAPRLAFAFADSAQFFDQPGNPHSATTGAASEGVYFTGAPRFAGLGCESCHIAGPGAVDLKLGADDPALFTDGYQPGHTYTFEVELNNETRGVELDGLPTCTEPRGLTDHYTYVPCNNNNFGLEIDTVGGGPLGGFAPSGDETLVAPGGDAVFGNRAHDATSPKVVTRNGPTRWHFFWTAPQAGTGPLTIFASMVDGNGGGGMESDDADPIGDDTVTAAVTLAESGAPAFPSASAGCALGPVSPGAPAGILMVLGAIGWIVRRRRA